MTPERIADYACVVGENPLWHPMERKLYWLDIDTGRMFRYDPVQDRHEQFYEGDPVGGFTLQEDGALLLFMARGAVKLWRGGTLIPVIDEIADEVDSRFNDVIADPEGRVFCGTMAVGDRPGRLYRLDTDGTITPVVEGVGCSNGMGFTADRRTMYYTDSEALEITMFDYDPATGRLSNRRRFAKTAPEDGVPDGMTVDAEGYVWSAHWDGSCIIRHSPDGGEVSRIRFPVRKVSSVTFGGPGCDDLYVTTAGGDQKETDGEDAGALFRLTPGVKGVPEFYSRIRVP